MEGEGRGRQLTEGEMMGRGGEGKGSEGDVREEEGSRGEGRGEGGEGSDFIDCFQIVYEWF